MSQDFMAVLNVRYMAAKQISSILQVAILLLSVLMSFHAHSRFHVVDHPERGNRSRGKRPCSHSNFPLQAQWQFLQHFLQLILCWSNWLIVALFLTLWFISMLRSLAQAFHGIACRRLVWSGFWRQRWQQSKNVLFRDSTFQMWFSDNYINFCPSVRWYKPFEKKKTFFYFSPDI